MNIKVDLSAPLSDDAKVKPMKTVKLVFTTSEYKKLVNAVSMFTRLTGQPKFRAVLQELHDYQPYEDIYETLLQPIEESIYKLPSLKTKKTATASTEGFFVKKCKPTDNSIKLYKLVKDEQPKVRYNQDEHTCISDVRMMLNVLTKVSKDSSKILKELAPETSKEFDTVNKSSIFLYAKEIIHWVGK
jgi:hypothetical protein